MVYPRVLAALCCATALHVNLAFSQDAASSELRAPSLSNSTMRLPADRQIVEVVNVAADDHSATSAPLARRAAMARYQVSADAIEAGRVVAVVDGRSEPVTEDNVASKAENCAIFIERLRDQPIEQQVPRNLALADGRPTALKLGFEVTAPTAGGQTVKVDTWARDSTGLSLDASQTAWVGNFFVALTNAQRPDDRSRLAAPLPVAVTAVGASSIDPRPFEISELGKWYEASIVVPGVGGDTYPVSVSADPRSDGDSVDLAVTRPVIQVASRSPSVVGWGIGQTNLDVEVAGLRNPAGSAVTLAGTGGVTLQPVVLDANGRGTTVMRSTRAPKTEVSVVSPEGASSPLIIPFDPPWLFLGSAAMGGLLGAFLRGRGRRHWAMAAAIGVASAVLMTLAYAVGINWPARLPGMGGLASSGEAVVLVLGAVAALVGVSALVPEARKEEPT